MRLPTYRHAHLGSANFQEASRLIGLNPNMLVKNKNKKTKRISSLALKVYTYLKYRSFVLE